MFGCCDATHPHLFFSLRQSVFNRHKGGPVPVTTTPPLVSLILISPSLALDLRNAVKDLNPECLISTGVLTATVSWNDLYDKIYVS